MLLIEADGKALFAEAGIPVPPGLLITRDPGSAVPATGDPGTLPPLPGQGPWMVKAQVPIGGRGQAGGVVRCATRAGVATELARLTGSRLKGHVVETCLVEQAATGQERYLAIMVDAASYGLRVIYASQGGVDVEASGAARFRLCAPHPGAVGEALADLLASEPAAWRSSIAAVGKALGTMVLGRELALAEINPLFVSDAGCIAGDAKVVIDLNAIGRQPGIAALVAARRTTYLDACRKIDEGFDYVELDPGGEIGLVTTGAGLSMMLIDELTARGARPLNFCDIRTGQMRGSPARLIRVLQWITAGPSLKVVLVNIFAGITDLAEFAGLLATAIAAAPDLHVPVVARLVGRDAAAAQQILQQAQPGMLVTEDLNAALRHVDAILGGRRMIGSLSRTTPVIVQGITGRMGRSHTAVMRAYGTNIVGGTSTRGDVRDAAGVPVFPTCAEAVLATAAVASVIMAPPEDTLAAVTEALAAGIKLIVTVAEGVPLHDAIRIGRAARRAGATWVGASTPGLAVPGECKLGFLPDVCLRPGPLAIMSKSGTLSYEVGYRLAQEGLGQSLWVGVGGDPVKGVRFADLLPVFFADPRTKGIILVGEVGGAEEEECAAAYARLGPRKPLFALIAGRQAKEGVSMGHAGALVQGDAGTLASKTMQLTGAGAKVFDSIDSLIDRCKRSYRFDRR